MRTAQGTNQNAPFHHGPLWSHNKYLWLILLFGTEIKDQYCLVVVEEVVIYNHFLTTLSGFYHLHKNQKKNPIYFRSRSPRSSDWLNGHWLFANSQRKDDFVWLAFYSFCEHGLNIVVFRLQSFLVVVNSVVLHSSLVSPTR